MPKIDYKNYFPENVDITKDGIYTINASTDAKNLTTSIQKKIGSNPKLNSYVKDVTKKKNGIVSIALKGKEADFKDNYGALRDGLVTRKIQSKIHYEDYFPEKVNINEKGILEINADVETQRLGHSILKRMGNNTELSLYVKKVRYPKKKQGGNTVTIELQGKEDEFKNNYKAFREGLIKRKASSKIQYEDYSTENDSIEKKRSAIKYEDYFPEKPDITKDGIFIIKAGLEAAYLAISIKARMDINSDLHFYATVTSSEDTVTIALQGEMDADFKNNYNTLRESLIARKKPSKIKYEDHFPEKPNISKDGIFTIIAGVEAPHLAKAIQMKMRRNTDLGFCATVTQSKDTVTVKLEGEEEDDFNTTYRVLREGLITRKKRSVIKFEDYFPEEPDTTNEDFNKGTFTIKAGAEASRLAQAIKFKMILNTNLHFYANVTQNAGTVKIKLQGENIEDFTTNYRSLREGLITKKKYSEIPYKDYFPENPNLSKDGIFTIPAGVEAKRFFIYIQRKMKHDSYLNAYTTITQKDNDVIIVLNGKNDEDFQKNYQTIREGLVVRKKKSSSNQAIDQMDLETENSLQSIFPPEVEQIEENTFQPFPPPEIEQDEENSSSSPIQPISPSFSIFSNPSRKRKEPDALSNKLNMLLSDVAQQIDSSTSIKEAATQLNTSPELLESALLEVNLSYDVIKNRKFQYQYLQDNNLLNSLNVDIVIQEETALKKKKT